MIYLAAVIILVLVVLIFLKKRPEKMQSHLDDIDTQEGFIKLYEDPLMKDLVFQTNGPRIFVVKAQVKSLHLKSSGEKVQVWNIRQGSNIASSVSDFYTNTVYTTPPHLRNANFNMDLVASVGPGEELKTNRLPSIKKVLVIIGDEDL